MTFIGICDCCHEIDKALQICTYCGKKVCLDCIDSRTHKCKLCKDEVERD